MWSQSLWIYGLKALKSRVSPWSYLDKWLFHWKWDENLHCVCMDSWKTGWNLCTISTWSPGRLDAKVINKMISAESTKFPSENPLVRGRFMKIMLLSCTQWWYTWVMLGFFSKKSQKLILEYSCILGMRSFIWWFL